MERRDFIKQLALLGIPALVSPKLLAAHRRVIDDALAQWKPMLEIARWSPSAHNIQPWLVEIDSAEQLHLYLDTGKLVPVADPDRAFITISMAMFAECIKISAENMNQRCSITFHEPRPDNQNLFASIHLRAEKAAPFCHSGLISKRKTSRLKYNGKPVEPAILQTLMQLASDHNVCLGHTNNRQQVEKVLELNAETLFTDIDDAAYRQELQKWLRTSDEEAMDKRDGLWYHCLGVSGRLLHNFFYHHARYRSSFKRELIRRKYMRSMSGTHDVVWFAASFAGFTDWVNCGTFLMRFWLKLTEQGCVMHPFGSLITHESTARQLPALLNHSGNELWFVARIGRSAEAPRSLRKDVSSLLKSK